MMMFSAVGAALTSYDLLLVSIDVIEFYEQAFQPLSLMLYRHLEAFEQRER